MQDLRCNKYTQVNHPDDVFKSLIFGLRFGREAIKYLSQVFLLHFDSMGMVAGIGKMGIYFNKQ